MAIGFLPVEDRIAQEVFYSGRVQGVGFRQSVYTLARKQDVQGYVQNLDNGKVRLVADGESKQVGYLLDSVKTIWANNISSIDRKDMPFHDQFSEFSIRY